MDVDLKYAHLIVWAVKNLSEREQQLIYIFENFQRAYITRRELDSGGSPSDFEINKMKRVESYVQELNIPVTTSSQEA
jgi:hypothetical protein